MVYRLATDFPSLGLIFQLPSPNFCFLFFFLISSPSIPSFSLICQRIWRIALIITESVIICKWPLLSVISFSFFLSFFLSFSLFSFFLFSFFLSFLLSFFLSCFLFFSFLHFFLCPFNSSPFFLSFSLIGQRQYDFADGFDEYARMGGCHTPYTPPLDTPLHQTILKLQHSRGKVVLSLVPFISGLI